MRHFPTPGGGMSGPGMLYGFFGFVGTLVVLGLIALLVVVLVRRAKGMKFGPGGPGPMGHTHHRPPMPPAVQILDERLAQRRHRGRGLHDPQGRAAGQRRSRGERVDAAGAHPAAARGAEPEGEDPSI